MKFCDSEYLKPIINGEIAFESYHFNDSKDSNMINCWIVLPTDIYLNDYVIDV